MNMQILNSQFLEDLKNKKKINLNLGSGNTRIDGMYSVDHLLLNNVDILADLNKPFDLIPSNSINKIYSCHVFEHITNFMELMSEIHRISKSDSEIHFIVPHFSNTYSFSDPTHVRFFGLFTMSYFVPQQYQPKIRKVPDFYTEFKFKIKKIHIGFYTESIFDKIVGRIFNKFVNFNFSTQSFYERRLCSLYHASQITYILEPIK